MDNQAPFDDDAPIEVRPSPPSHEQTPLLHEHVPQGASSQAPSTPGWRNPSVNWLMPLLLIYMLGFGGTIVPKINLMISLICRDYLADKTAKDPAFTYVPVIFGGENRQCQIPEVQSLVARFQLYFNLIAGILSALASPRLGHLSDRYGRTRVLALSALATVLAEAVVLVIAAKPETISVHVLFVVAFLDGLGGSFTTIIALASSYASDCTAPEKRSVAFGYLYGAFFTGIAGGPLLVAVLLKKTGGAIVGIFAGALGLVVLFLLAVLFVVPESLSPDLQQIAQEKHQNSKQSNRFTLQDLNPMKLIAPLAVLFPPAGRPSSLFPGRHGASPALRRNIVLLAVLDTIAFGLAMGGSQVMVIYAEYMFGWGNVESSIFISVVSAVRVFNLTVINPIVKRVFQETGQDRAIPGSDPFEIVLIRASMLLDVVANVGFAASKHGSAMVVAGVVAALGGLGVPTMQSALTKHVPRDRVGQILGAKGLLHALSRVVAPAVCNLVYSLTVRSFPPAIFVGLAGVFGLALMGSFCIRPHVTLEEWPHDEDHEEGERLLNEQQ